MPRRLIVLALLALVCPAAGAAAASSYDLHYRVEDPRNAFWPPIATFILPGFDQWAEKQYPYAQAYSGAGLAGNLIARGTFESRNVYDDDSDVRFRELGAEMYLTAGGYSLYHSFRTAAKSQQKGGDFLFLGPEEQPEELALSAFRFGHLTRATTIFPVALAAAIAGLRIGSSPGDPFTYDEALYAFGFSYGAGNWEEAVFRGWMMPTFTEWTHSPFLGGFLSGTIFGGLHAGRGFIPWPQTLMGYYLGWVSQRNGWTLSEVIFIHTWWDAILFASSYATASVSGKRVPATFWMPVFQASF
jgi:hypothetical protein